MATSRRSESDVSDYEEAGETDLGLFSSADIDTLRLQLSEKCSAVNCYLLSSKEQIDKRRLVENTMSDLLSAFNRVAAAYDRLNSFNLALTNVKTVVKKAIGEEVPKAFSKPTLQTTSSSRSFADVASRPAKHGLNKVKVSNGPTITVPNTKSFVIGPKADQASKFSSADVTRMAVMKAVNPTDVSLKVSRVLNVRNNAVRIIAEDADVEKLRSSPALSAAGLEIKLKEKMNPRLVIRGVPTGKSPEDLLKEIGEMNSNVGCTADNIKVVYRYPPRDNSTVSSVVVETNSDVRRGLLTQGRIYLAWQSCKIEDHLRVLQCFKCQGFNHLAKNCSAEQICGHCAGLHSTSSCPKTKSAPTCHNCFTAKLSQVDHRAFDSLKCPMLKQRLTDKAKNISY